MTITLKLVKKQFSFFANFFLITMFGFMQAKGQGVLFGNNSNLYTRNEQMHRNSFSISIGLGFSAKAIIKRETGEYNIRSTPQPMWEAGGFLQNDLNNNLFFKTGLMVTISMRNASFHAPAHEINPFGYSDNFPALTANDVDFGISVPAILEKDWFINDSKMAYILWGLNLRYSFGFDEDSYDNYLTDTAGQRVDVFSLNLNSNNHKKPWLTGNVGGGYGWILRNNDMIKVGLVANISISKIVRGNYEINVPGHPISSGGYAVKGNYLAIAVGYVFIKK
jgi:hypothetical protein